jgi:BirA family biotin operon repressor/biotin-[acetyl-CoA-carboxylase] ligase
MPHGNSSEQPAALPSSPQPWRIIECEEVASTLDVAATLDPWCAVRARRQTSGRGRFNRAWVSDEGGLWLSAVVPLSTGIPGWEALPLVAGWAVVDTVRALGVNGARMRWPNDIMVGERKLAGLLVERPGPGRAVIGIGLNVTNDPGSQNNAIKCCVTRLAEAADRPPPALSDLTLRLLFRLHGAVQEWQSGGFAALADRVNSLWRRPSAVQLDLNQGSVRGWFEGVTENGALRLAGDGGVMAIYPAHEVTQLKELETELESQL